MNLNESPTSDTNFLLSQEYKKVKQYAKGKLQQRNQRNLFRPNTGMTFTTSVIANRHTSKESAKNARPNNDSKNDFRM